MLTHLGEFCFESLDVDEGVWRAGFGSKGIGSEPSNRILPGIPCKVPSGGHEGEPGRLDLQNLLAAR